MKKPITLCFIGLLFLSCQSYNQTEKLEAEIIHLKHQNDSLGRIVDGIKDKYVFDSLIVRQISDYKNTNKLNSIYKEEIVFVGYNSNGKTSVIIGDSTYFDDGLKVFKGDTLISKKGAFLHEIKLEKDLTSYGGIIKTENDYGKIYEESFRALIGVIKD